MSDAPERFVCRPRGGAEIRIAECFAEHRIARASVSGRATAACDQCVVGGLIDA